MKIGPLDLTIKKQKTTKPQQLINFQKIPKRNFKFIYFLILFLSFS